MEGAINMNPTLTLPSGTHYSTVDICINNHENKEKMINAIERDNKEESLLLLGSIGKASNSGS